MGTFDDRHDATTTHHLADLPAAQLSLVSTALDAEGIAHSIDGDVLTAPAAEVETVQRLIAQVRAGDALVDSEPAPAVIPTGFVEIDDDLHELASVRRRIGAFLVEGLVVAALIAPMTLATDVDATGVTMTISLLSHVLLVSLTGRTIGMWILQIRIADADRNDSPDWRDALIRYLTTDWPVVGGLAVGAIATETQAAMWGLFAVGWLAACFTPILTSPSRQGLHDRWANTVVLR